MKTFVSLLVASFLFCTSGPISAQATQTGNKLPKTAGKNLVYAYFPTAVPVALLAEVIKRDNILKKTLGRQGMAITFQPFAKGNDIITLVAAKKIAAVAMSDMPTIEATITGDMQILGIVKQSHAAVIASQGTLIKDLRGKRIGNAFGSTSHYALLQALNSAGLAEKDVSLVPLDVNEMPDAIAQGKIEAFAAWEPTPTAALQKYPGRFTTLHKQASLAYFMISQNLVEQSPKAAKELIAALARAIRWLKKDSANLILASRWTLEGMKTFTGKTSSLAEHDIARITRSDLLDVPGAPLIPHNDKTVATPLSREFEFLKKIGKLPPNSKWEQVSRSFRSDLTRQVLANPREFALNRFDYAK